MRFLVVLPYGVYSENLVALPYGVDCETLVVLPLGETWFLA